MCAGKVHSFHENIKFAYEPEKKTFLHVLLIRTRNNIETTVYRKPTTVIATFFKLEIVRT